MEGITVDLPSDLFWFPLPIRDLWYFWLALTSGEKRKTPRYLWVCLSYIGRNRAGDGVSLDITEIFIEEWIVSWMVLAFFWWCGRVFLYLAGGYRWCPVAHLVAQRAFRRKREQLRLDFYRNNSYSLAVSRGFLFSGDVMERKKINRLPLVQMLFRLSLNYPTGNNAYQWRMGRS